jgi:hypothetical protein
VVANLAWHDLVPAVAVAEGKDASLISITKPIVPSAAQEWPETELLLCTKLGCYMSQQVEYAGPWLDLFMTVCLRRPTWRDATMASINILISVWQRTGSCRPCHMCWPPACCRIAEETLSSCTLGRCLAGCCCCCWWWWWWWWCLLRAAHLRPSCGGGCGCGCGCGIARRGFM